MLYFTYIQSNTLNLDMMNTTTLLRPIRDADLYLNHLCRLGQLAQHKCVSTEQRGRGADFLFLSQPKKVVYCNLQGNDTAVVGYPGGYPHENTLSPVYHRYPFFYLILSYLFILLSYVSLFYLIELYYYSLTFRCSHDIINFKFWPT